MEERVHVISIVRKDAPSARSHRAHLVVVVKEVIVAEVVV